MNHKEYAMQLFKDGYNCSQAVTAAFSDVTGVSFEDSVKIASSFGGGMGRMREVCGAVSGMFLVLGMIEGYSDPKDNVAKKAHYEKVQKLAEEFKQEHGTIICRELLGLNIKGADDPTPAERTDTYYKKRPCVEMVGTAAEILDRYLENK